MWVNILLKAVLFMVLLPGSHFRIPQGGTLKEQALVHGILFAVVNYLAYKAILPILESFDNPDTKVNPPCPEGYKQCPSGDCVPKGSKQMPCPN